MFLVGAIALAALAASQMLGEAAPLVVTGWLLWVVLLVLISFFLIGAGGIVRALLQVSASAERRSVISQRATEVDLLSGVDKPAPFPNVEPDADITNSPGVRLAYRLPAVETPFWQVLSLAIFCVVWNAIAASLTVLAVKTFLAGEPDWFLTMFLVPFVGLGVWVIYYFLRRLLFYTGIGPSNVEISDHPLYPGRSYQVFLSQSGQLRVKRLEIALVCEEEAAYRHGTDIRTDRAQVYRKAIFSKKNFDISPGLSHEEQVDLPIPENAMHSFKSTSNAVRWRLILTCRAQGWPLIERAFPIVVYPCSAENAP